MSARRRARAQLVARARQELPEPGDQRRLAEDLAEIDDAVASEALAVLTRTTLAWTQLRDLRLERAWQSGFGWFLARNLMLFGLVVLVLALTLRPVQAAVEGALAGAALYYLIVMLLGPLRLRRHTHRRRGILAAYEADLSGYLEQLEAPDAAS